MGDPADTAYAAAGLPVGSSGAADQRYSYPVVGSGPALARSSRGWLVNLDCYYRF